MSEKEKITLEIPKPILAYYGEGEESLENRLVGELVEKALGQVESIDAETLMETFKLKPVFKAYDVLPEYYERAGTEPGEKEKLEMVNVNVTLYKPFYEFIKAYLAFFGSKQSLEDVCREMIYQDIEALYNQLKGFPHIDDQDWFHKWGSVALAAFDSEVQELEES